MTPAGFEPAPPKRSELKSDALDQLRHGVFVLFLSALFDANQIKSLGRENYCCEHSLKAPYGVRTRGPVIKSHMLYQLS
jgi:hypothetical protein